MTCFEKLSLLFAGITAFGVIVGIVVSIVKFLSSKRKKVIADFVIHSFSKNEKIVNIIGTMDLINQTESPTSITDIVLTFKNFEVCGTHIEQPIQNLLQDVKTKNISLMPFESLSLERIKFSCPIEHYKEKAKLKIKTIQRTYKYSILCQAREVS